MPGIKSLKVRNCGSIFFKMSPNPVLTRAPYDPLISFLFEMTWLVACCCPYHEFLILFSATCIRFKSTGAICAGQHVVSSAHQTFLGGLSLEKYDSLSGKLCLNLCYRQQYYWFDSKTPFKSSPAEIALGFKT